MKFEKLIEKPLIVTKEPLAGADLQTIFRLLKQNRFHISFCYLPRLIYSILLSTALTPFRFKDRKMMNLMNDQIKINKSPLFLLGHWRGGTTYLHNMLSKDDQFGFFSTFDAYLPGASIYGEKLLKGIVANSLPETRPMDDVRMGADFPQEEEYALGGSCIYSYYHGWCFPKNMDQYDRYVWLDDVDEETIEDFKKIYIYLLKVATYKNNERRLLLKNPSNTARVNHLIDMFPDAKFVHIHRNPYHQYLSMVRFMQKVIPLYCVQSPPAFKKIDNHILNMYKRMYLKYLKDKKLVPKDNIVEVKYEDFVKNPMNELENIYHDLQLTGFTQNRKRFYAYMLSQSEINPRSYSITDEIREKISSHWGFAFDAFGYEK